MAATTTPSITWLIKQIHSLYPQLQFEKSNDFSWRPQDGTILYRDDGAVSILLHEIGHALSDHTSYERDIELLAMECEAWEKARYIAKNVAISLDEQLVEEHLDTYRDWLHSRSSCVTCHQTGIEVSKHHYSCPACGSEWRVNDARQCQLRRYRIK